MWVVFVRRSEGGRGLIGVEECVGIETNSLLEYISRSDEGLLTTIFMHSGFHQLNCINYA